MNSGLRVGIDIGGTFTDFVLLEPDGIGVELHKRLTTPEDPASGVMDGLAELFARTGFSLAQCDEIVHGTTLVTNAIIERTGVETGLLTTRGFADILEMGREQRYDIYDLFLEYPEPLVPRRFRFEIDERIDRDGEVRRALDPEDVRASFDAFARAGVRSVAVSFLHAYRNPDHERLVAEVARGEFPDLSVSLSSEVAPEIREFERTSTTVANAYVQPLVEGYVGRLEAHLVASGFSGRFFLMQSSGGLATPETIRKYPIRLLESGPAGGALIASFVGSGLGESDVFSFDMGGTTAKACLVRDGRPDLAPEMEAARVHRFKRGSGLSIKSPVIDLMEIGAGGGSIASADRLGLLKVGPQSSGASPGPACYGQGGALPTVTDACLALGYFDPDYFLGGTMTLDAVAATEVLTALGERLGISDADAAWGIYSVVCENMAAAARVHIIEKGCDPRRYPMIAFGGAGPATAARVARSLGTPEVIVPPVSGVASAMGFLVTPISFEFSRSFPGELRALEWTRVSEIYSELEEQAASILASSGVGREEIAFARTAEMRLSGQFHDIEIPVLDGYLDEVGRDEIERTFRSEYERLFHSVLPGHEPMAINWRLRAAGPSPDVSLEGVAGSFTSGTDGSSKKGERLAYFPESRGFVEVPVYDRYGLRFGEEISGPAIVEERESTFVVNPEDALSIDGSGNMRIRIGG